MKLKLLLQILILSSFSYMLQANTSVANATAASVVQSVGTVITLTGITDSPNLTFSIVTQPSHGTLTYVNSPTTTSARYTYTSTGSYIGADSFDFQVTNNLGLVSAPAKVPVMILPQSARAYVAETNNDVGIISVANQSATGLINDPHGLIQVPVFIAVSPNGAKAYIGCASAVVSINAITNTVIQKVDDSLSSFFDIFSIAFTPDGTKAYACNLGITGVSIIDVATDKVIGTVNANSFPFGGPISIAITPDGMKAYVCNPSIQSVSIIDLNPSSSMYNQVVGYVTDTSLYFQNKALINIIISPNGNQAYIAVDDPYGGSGSVVIVDVATNATIGTIDDSVHHYINSPDSIVITSDGLKAYVANTGDDNIVIVDLNPVSGTYNQVTGEVSVSPSSSIRAVEFTADGSQAYVSNPGSGIVDIIDVASNSVILSIPGYSSPIGIAFLGDNPTANPIAATAVQSVERLITLTGTDPVGETLTFTIPTPPLHGTLTYVDSPTTTSARYTYTSTGSYIGADSFDFQVTNSSSLVSFPVTVPVMILPQSARAYVADSSSNDVGIISVANESATGLINDPHGFIQSPTFIAVSPNGAKAYIGCGSAVVSINAITNTVIQKVDDSLSNLSSIYSIAFTPDGTKAYACNLGINGVSIIDVATDKVIGTVNANSFPFRAPISIAITPDGMKAYVCNPASQLVSIIDLNPSSSMYNQVVGYVIDTSLYFQNQVPINIIISPNGNQAYIAAQGPYGGSGSVVIVDVATNATIGIIGDSGSLFQSPDSIVITSDGLKAYVANTGNDYVVIVDLNPGSGTYNQVTGELLVSSSYAIRAVEFTADGSRAYVTNPGSGIVDIIDVASNSKILSIPGYSSPIGIAFLGIGSPFFSINNQMAPHVAPVASALDSTTGIMYEVGNAETSGNLVVMASGVNVENFGPITSFTKSGKFDGGVISYSTTSLLNIGGASFTQLDMALQTVNGVSKIIVSGSNDLLNKGFVARFNTIPVANSLDGVLDDTFGDYQSGSFGPQKGYTVFNGVAPAAGKSTFSSCGVDADQKIVVAGSVGVGGGTSTGQLLIARYTSNGFLDTTFGPQNPATAPQLGYGYSTILGLSGTGYSLSIHDIEFDPLKNIFIVGQYTAPLIPAPGLGQNGVAGTSPFIAKFVHLGVPDQTFYTQFGTLMIPMQYVNGQGEFNKCLYDISPISNLSSPTMYASGVIKNLKTSPATDYATLIRFTIANLNLSASQAFISGNSGVPLTNLLGNICPSLVVPAVTAVVQISGAQGPASAIFNSIKTSQDVQNIISLPGVVYNLISLLQGAGASATVAQSIGDNFQTTMIAVIDNFVANYTGNLLQNFLFLSQSIAVNECLLTTNVSKFIYLQLIYAAEKAIQINVKTAASYCTSPLISPYG